MIDLSCTRERLLAEIGALELSGRLACDITDPRVLEGDVRVHLRGHTRADLFPLLKVVLSERFSSVPRPALVRDLLMPLKHALGNAYKRGNGRDPAKHIALDIVMTSKGAVIAVTDEGDGFDVDLVVRRMQQNETYFDHHGSGFRNLHRATSAVTWENGGRTLLLGFRPSIERDPENAPFLEMINDETLAGPDEDGGPDSALHRVVDSAWIRTCLSKELLLFRNGRAKLEACHSYTGRGLGGDDCGTRYVSILSSSSMNEPETRILTGRLHEEEATAAADFQAAVGLADTDGWKGLRIPQPVCRSMAEPRLVLYDFDPWMNLWQYLTYRGSLKALRHSARRAGEALAILHRSRPALGLAEPDLVGTRFNAMIADGERALEGLAGGADLVERFRVGVQRIQGHARYRRERVRVPIHGALGWDRIHYAVDGYFYFYRFETCQQYDPAIDLGGFAADLLRFTLADDDFKAYRTCREELLSSYNAQAEQTVGEEELPFYTGLALGERVRSAPSRSLADTRGLLAALEVAGAF